MGRRWPRIEKGDRLSRIGGGKAHALIGGELIRSLAIVSRGGHRQLQEARPGAQQMDGKHRGTGSTSAAREVQRWKEKRRKRVNFVDEDREKEEKEEKRAMCGQRKQQERKSNSKDR